MLLNISVDYSTFKKEIKKDTTGSGPSYIGVEIMKQSWCEYHDWSLNSHCTVFLALGSSLRCPPASCFIGRKGVNIKIFRTLLQNKCVWSFLTLAQRLFARSIKCPCRCKEKVYTSEVISKINMLSVQPETMLGFFTLSLVTSLVQPETN